MPDCTSKKYRSLLCFSIKFMVVNIEIDKTCFQNVYFHCLQGGTIREVTESATFKSRCRLEAARFGYEETDRSLSE